MDYKNGKIAQQIIALQHEDEPIRKAVDCMVSCLRGERKIDNYWEKGRDWDLFTKLMLSTWVRIFEPENKVALEFAKHWVNIFEKAFEQKADCTAKISAILKKLRV